VNDERTSTKCVLLDCLDQTKQANQSTSVNTVRIEYSDRLWYRQKKIKYIIHKYWIKQITLIRYFSLR